MQRSTHHGDHRLLAPLLLALGGSVLAPLALAQEPVGRAGEPQQPSDSAEDELPTAPAKVDVNPIARDEEIRARLQNVLVATEWFTEPRVRVEEGVVFVHGRVGTTELKQWASELASNTQDVVAVVNRMEVPPAPFWDFGPTRSGLSVLWRDSVRSLPFVAFGLLILALSAVAGLLATRRARAFLHHRIRATLLRNVIARGAGVIVFLLGVYVVLRVAGLTQLALTVIGGTGLIGLAVGIAFRDITENFLASIFLSVQRPFETGDLIEVSGVTGYAQQLNVRTTILMTLDGNLVQVPNAAVYKSNLVNFTTNSNRRDTFLVGIGYDDSITEAQEIARRVLADHPAILDDPEPSVLVENLGPSTVNLRLYFWLNGREHSFLKVRSSVIRLVKRAFQQHGISMPDEAREIVFPQGIPVTMVDGQRARAPDSRARPEPIAAVPKNELAAISTKAEAGLYSEAVAIEEQAQQAQLLKSEENLLPTAPAAPGTEEQSAGSEPHHRGDRE
jgi:small conductance mechanosensitive channel